MAEGRSGLTKYHPDGTVGVTVGDRRHTLTVPTLGDLEDLRALFRDLTAEREDWLDLTFRPGVSDLRKQVKASTDAEERKAIRSKLTELEVAQDRLAQDSWARWWRECFDRLSRDDLPGFDERPAEGLPIWMIESPDPIPRLFAHWRSDPSEGSGDQTAATLAALQSLTDLSG